MAVTAPRSATIAATARRRLLDSNFDAPLGARLWPEGACKIRKGAGYLPLVHVRDRAQALRESAINLRFAMSFCCAAEFSGSVVEPANHSSPKLAAFSQASNREMPDVDQPVFLSGPRYEGAVASHSWTPSPKSLRCFLRRTRRDVLLSTSVQHGSERITLIFFRLGLDVQRSCERGARKSYPGALRFLADDIDAIQASPKAIATAAPQSFVLRLPEDARPRHRSPSLRRLRFTERSV